MNKSLKLDLALTLAFSGSISSCVVLVGHATTLTAIT